MHRGFAKKGVLWLLTAVLSLMALYASAEYGRVVTPGGPVKMRKNDSSKGKLVCEIPNRSIIEADEVGDEWSHVTYNGKSGWVMTKYLKLASMDQNNGITIQIEPENIHVGDEVHITVHAENTVTCRFTVDEGKNVIEGKENNHPDTYYRPRKAGLHCVQVNVRDADGKDTSAEVFFTVDEATEEKQESDEFILYSQKDGWWIDQKYSSSNLDASGCAIFTLAHALQLLDYKGEDIRPENLAKKYAFCLVDGGTLNQTLIGRTARDFGYKTQEELYKNKNTIRDKLNEGAVFTFAIVKGHIALAAGVDEEAGKVMIVDSAPSCTLERIQNGKMYYKTDDGKYQVISDLSEVPDTRYYFETDQYGGLIYYLDLDYVAKRGVRLIQPK